MKRSRDASSNSGDQTTWVSTAGSPAPRDPPVDHPGQATIAQQTVAFQIAVHPDGRARMGACGESRLPDGERRRGVDEVGGAFDDGTGRSVVLPQRAGTVPGRRGTVGGNESEPFDEDAQVRGKGHRRVHVLEPRRFPFDPPLDRPREGIALAGFADRHRLGNRHRKVGCESGQPRRVPYGLVPSPADAGESDHQVLTQAPNGVVGSPRLDDRQWQVGQCGHLCPKQATHQGLVDGYLVRVHGATVGIGHLGEPSSSSETRAASNADRCAANQSRRRS